MDYQDNNGAARLLRGYRREAGLTQHGLAETAGISIGVVRDLEQGRTSRLQERSIMALVRAFGLAGRREDEFVRALRGASSRGHSVPAPAEAASLPPQAHGGLWLRVLGPLQAWRDGTSIDLGQSGQRAVLGLLALSPNGLVSRKVIIDALWGDHPPTTAVSLVQSHVSRLRRTLEPGKNARDPQTMIVSTATGYCLRVGTDKLDLLAFRAMVSAAKMARCSDAGAACDLYDEALRLWQGEPLADVRMLGGQAAVSSLVRQLRVTIIEYAEVACGAGLHERVLFWLEDLTVREPFDERAHAQLMIALAGDGEQAAALRVYENMVHRLDEQLGLRPGAELRDAYQRILRQDLIVAPKPSPSAAARVSHESPAPWRP